MTPEADRATVQGWVVEAARALDAKQGRDVVVLDVGDVLSITDWFVVADAANERQVRALVDEVERRLKELDGPRSRRVEGLDSSTWVLLDYGDFVVHVFSADARGYYELERLWSDVPRLDWSEGGAAPAAAGEA